MTSQRALPSLTWMVVAVLAAAVPVGGCVDSRSTARPSKITLIPDDSARAEVEWRFSYDGARVSDIERKEDGDFVTERRYDYDADGFLKELTIENRETEILLDITTDDGVVTLVTGDGQVTSGNVTIKVDITIELELDRDRRASRLLNDSFYERTDDTLPFAIQRTTLTSSEELEFAFDDNGRVVSLEGDRLGTSESALGSIISTTTTNTDIEVEFRYSDDGLTRVTRDEAATTNGNTVASSWDMRLSWDNGKIVEIEDTVRQGNTTVAKDHELTFDDQGRVIEIKNDDESIEIEYDDEPLEGPTIALPTTSFPEYLDLAGKAFTTDYRLEHLLLP
jgi:hypothetical protein